MDAKKRKLLEDAGVIYPSVVTNADRIRAMTDEELATTIFTGVVCAERSFKTQAELLDWLKQEASP